MVSWKKRGDFWRSGNGNNNKIVRNDKIIIGNENKVEETRTESFHRTSRSRRPRVVHYPPLHKPCAVSREIKFSFALDVVCKTANISCTECFPFCGLTAPVGEDKLFSLSDKLCHHLCRSAHLDCYLEVVTCFSLTPFHAFVGLFVLFCFVAVVVGWLLAWLVAWLVPHL